MEKPTTPDAVFENSCFGVSVIGRRDLALTYKIMTDVFTAYTLRHQYISDLDGSDFWYDFVTPRTERLCRLETMKLKKEDRDVFESHRYLHENDVHWDGIKSYKFPLTWTFYDDEIPKWYKTWEKYRQEKDDELYKSWRIK